MNGHVHANNMALYAEDSKETATPWDRWEFSSNGTTWFTIDCNPEWHVLFTYRRKPKTININGFEVPEPVRTKLDRNIEYYMPELNVEGLYVRSFWTNDPKDYLWLKRGIIHLTKEAAMAHAEALLSFTKKEY